jgi:hypothetical protein
MSEFEKFLSEAVNLGAAWLDANYPGWVEMMRLETLDLASSCDCILGQRFGDYCDFCAANPEMSRQWRWEHGFCCVPQEPWFYGLRPRQLTALWRAKIIALRAQVELPSQSGAVVESAAKIGAT